MSSNIQIDPEFKALIPALKPEELEQLEKNIVADGCRDPLVVWGDLLIDGHNRFEICTRLGIEYGVTEVEFGARQAALDWIDDNQLGRRNLTPEQTALILGRKYNRSKKAVGSVNQYTSASRQNDGKQTAETLATQHGVSPRTVERAGQFADAVEVIEAAAPGFTETVLAGSGVSRNDVVKAATVVQQIPEAAEDIVLAAEFAHLPDEVKQEAIAEITKQQPAREVMQEAVKRAHVANNSGNNEWYTPSKYIELARTVMGSIDTDPASSEIANKVVCADKYFTADTDGRNQEWFGNVWMNPPYAQPLMGEFAELVTSKYEKSEIEQACILVNNATETHWFQRMMDAASAVCFTKGRIKFVDVNGNPGGAPLQGQAIIYMGSNTQDFVETFADEGTVLTNA